MSFWLQNLQIAFDTFPVTVLHGNVRDWYHDGSSTPHEDLVSLVRHYLVLRRPFDEMLTVTGTPTILRTRRLTIEGEPGDGARPVTNLERGQADTREFFASLNEQLREPSPRRVVMVNYIDKLIPYRSAGPAGTEVDILYHIERTIQAMNSDHRMVLVSLTDGRVPTELYTNSPRIRLVEVPLPDFEDRDVFLGQHMEETEHDARRVLVELTDGLYMQHLVQVVKELPEMRKTGLSSRSMRETINRLRLGVQRDYWADLSFQSIGQAEQRIGKTRQELDDLDGDHKPSEAVRAFDAVKGQSHAVRRVIDALTVARSGLADVGESHGSRPRIVLLFAGPSGVGKTFLAKSMAKFLFGASESFIRIDMSEFQEEHSVARLIGSPPGYVGFERGGQLTNAVKEKPFSVILFDEIEKAHQKVLDIFLQVLDDGRLTDSRGQSVFFSEAVIVLTTNIGTREHNKQNQPCSESSDMRKILDRKDTTPGERRSALREHFKRSVEHFFRQEISRPELLNRIGQRIVPFDLIDSLEVQEEIILGHLSELRRHFEERFRAAKYRVVYDDALVNYLLRKHGHQFAEFGGRGISNSITAEVILPLSRAALTAEHMRRSNVTIKLSPLQDSVRAEVLA